MSALEFDQMLVNHTDFLKPFAFTLTRDPETAKDLLQETMLRALVNREKYHVGTNVKAWLYTIMRNIFINHYRRRVKQNTIFDSTPNNFFLNYQRATVPDSAEAALQMKEMQAAIHQLPGIFKSPFVLYFEGFRYHEIARILNEPLGTIKSRIHFARKLLREQISRY
jgi:RNA polymerase sigma-70 factor (ECF subfamily)